MKIFVTGATGYIGHHLTKELVARNFQVVALVRSKEKASDLAAIGVKLFVGDLIDLPIVEQAMQGADAVFHLAAYAKIWPDDEQIYKKINVEGTATVLASALKNKVKKVIITSTAGVYGPSASADAPVNETSQRTLPFSNFYESTKAEAEEIARSYAKMGIQVVIVNPTRVYGPGIESESNAVSKLIQLYLEGKWHLIPGDGKRLGNYSFIDDVVAGHINALLHGKSGENYLLGGENASYDRLFELIKNLSGKQFRLFHIPVPLIILASRGMKLGARLQLIKPLITPEWARRYLLDWNVSSLKATQQLGYTITPLEEGLKRTIEWLQKK